MNKISILLLLVLMVILLVFLLFLMVNKLSNPQNMFKSIKKIQSSDMMGKVIETQKEMLNKYESELKEISKKTAEIESEGIEIKAKAFKKGFDKKG